MCSDYSFDDREAEARASSLGRKVRLKKPLEISAGNSLSRVLNLSQQYFARRVVSGRDSYLPLTGNGSERFQRIVGQVHKHALDLFGIKHRRRQLLGQF